MTWRASLHRAAHATDAIRSSILGRLSSFGTSRLHCIARVGHIERSMSATALIEQARYF
jgi:hypothetical protein